MEPTYVLIPVMVLMIFHDSPTGFSSSQTPDEYPLKFLHVRYLDAASKPRYHDSHCAPNHKHSHHLMTVELRAINPSKLMVLARMLLSSFVFSTDNPRGVL